ncbi:3-ketoacyl-CoA thiolase, peroxisomal [Psilocybe cubensis]|uniref:3-ketoacyl-CoA thiolase, peroxisomal n=1 Tax=Psilocybe cubensis TaxID=181762 RepID=A0ACB8HHK2_PSICU|nr:3-ketoacyl-CoA thiolase, peroxisomal [Psilocybe cubensis]KAH9486590.1 3-ketoacyl-CoA thiolase, peroxisomal [Psilocybe cubensis]
MQRVKQLAAHFTGTDSASGLPLLESKRPDDVVITLAIRSPLCKAKKGGFKDTRTDELMLEMFKHVVSRSGVEPGAIGDVCVGTVLTPDAAYYARAAMLAAGIPDTVPVQIVNRFCSSGLMAVTTVANQVRSGQIKIGLAIGVESMSENPDKGGPTFSELISCNAASQDCQERMGWTSENVAAEFNITRDEQDTFAAESFKKAEEAQKRGYFAEEIVPFTVLRKNAGSDTRVPVVVEEDDGIRAGTTKEKLSKIKAAFPQWGNGTTTGGNASQITDGAAAILVMTRAEAEKRGLPILAKHITTAVAGVPPRIMGVGPVYAIPLALENAGLQLCDVDLFEVGNLAHAWLIQGTIT